MEASSAAVAFISCGKAADELLRTDPFTARGWSPGIPGGIPGQYTNDVKMIPSLKPAEMAELEPCSECVP